MTNINFAQGNMIAEAICGGLVRTDWKHLGDMSFGMQSWFIRGDFPKQLKVCVERPSNLPQVSVLISWPSATGNGVGRQQLTVALGRDNDVRVATEQVLISVLSKFKQVLEGTAG